MIVAVYAPHNEGRVAALITGPEFDSADLFVDLYEVDASVASFATQAEAEEWLLVEHDIDCDLLVARPGGAVLIEEY